MVVMRGSGRTVGFWLLVVMAAAGLGGGAGCSGGGSGPLTHPVKGRVVSPGGQPWTSGTVTFRSVSDPGTLAIGDIQSDGTFTLVTHYLEEGLPRTRPGAVAGEHTVTVETTGGPVDRDGVSSIPPVAVSRKYRVEAKENDFTIEARKPARP
jgi:hypothetical protein